MTFFVYILKCVDGSYYTGQTENLEQRIAQHKQRSFPDCYTANRLPIELMFQQAFPTREEALAAERRIKGWSRKKKEAMMRGEWGEVSKLARSYATKNKPKNPVNPEPQNPAHPEPVEGCKHRTTAHSESQNPVHPEPVEGCKHRANHPSTPLRVNGDDTHDQ